jgi:hypothetical protein
VIEHYDVIIMGAGGRFGNDPAFTAMANAIRVGEHLLSRMS